MGFLKWFQTALVGGDQGHREFPFWRWQIPGPLLEKSRLELMTYLQANTFIIARKCPKLTHFYQLYKTQQS